MNRIGRFAALTTLSAVLATGVAIAQDDHRDDHRDNNGYSHDDHRDYHHDADHHDNHAYVRHEEWRGGYHMDHNDWDRGERVDYNTYHLARPRRGYEWREVDGNFVMAAVATGVIATVVAANAH